MSEPSLFLRGADVWVLVDAMFPYDHQDPDTGKVVPIHAAMIDGVLVCSQERYDRLREEHGGSK